MARGQRYYEEQERIREEYRRVRAALLAIVDCPKVEPADRLRAAELVVMIDEAGGIIEKSR